MRFLHTADWHLGRILHGVSLLDDQRYTLDGFCDVVRDVRPDAVVISGDVYDRAAPPADAVAALDEFLTRLVMERRVRVIAIAGNHDSPERLAFGSRVLSSGGLDVVGPLAAEPASILLADTKPQVRFWAVPYAEPPSIATLLDDDSIRGHEAAMCRLLDRIRERKTDGERSVLVAHAFVAGGSVSESERPLSVGGTGAVAAEAFHGFDYVALGHLHRPQSLDGGAIRYSGSLLKYSFNEWEQPKSVSLVEIPESGPARVEEIKLPIKHDLRKISGTLDQLLSTVPAVGRDDYIWADLLDATPVYNAVERLRSIYPNIMYAARLQTAIPAGNGDGPRPDPSRHTLSQLFHMFYKEINGEELSEAHTAVLTGLIEEFERTREGR